MVGSNVLFLPDAVRIAHGIPYAMGLLAVIGIFSFASMVVLARCCEKTQCFSYRKLWSRAFGDKNLWLIDLCIGANAIIACVSYCLLIERFLEVAMQGLFPGSLLAALPAAAKLAAVVVFVIFPLCLMRDLSSLKQTSALGLGVTLLVAVFVAQDFFTNYSVPLPDRGGLTSSEIFAQWDAMPGTHLFQAAALLTNAFSVHYNVPKLYGELDEKDRSVGSFTKVVLATFAFALLTELVFIFCGYGRFGGAVESTLLSSYPPSVASLGCWLLMASNIMVTYPIVFNSVQASAMVYLEDLEKVKEPKWVRSLASQRTALTALIVGGTAVLGHSLDSLSFINALKGAVALSAIAFIFPGILHLEFFKGKSGGGGSGLALAWSLLCKALVAWGFLSCGVGLVGLAIH